MRAAQENPLAEEKYERDIAAKKTKKSDPKPMPKVSTAGTGDPKSIAPKKKKP